MREKRRAERKQFKLDRAKAIAAVAAEAEAVYAAEGRVIVPALTGPEIPSAATWRPSVSNSPDIPSVDTETSPPNGVEDDSEPLDDIEHLQLTLSEAFFLLWNLDCLTVLDPDTVVTAICVLDGMLNIKSDIQLEPMSLQQIWIAFQKVHLPYQPPDIPHRLQLDNPFLIHYIAYHHYRSLGWVVKGGIKFCVDYLLYKRGPVFTHAEYGLFRYQLRIVTISFAQVRHRSLPGLRRSRRPRNVSNQTTKRCAVYLVVVKYHQSSQFTSTKGKSLFRLSNLLN
jgi:tRNA-splicing endonuclease subunit Sen2